jgi:hypothetical protein
MAKHQKPLELAELHAEALERLAELQQAYKDTKAALAYAEDHEPYTTAGLKRLAAYTHAVREARDALIHQQNKTNVIAEAAKEWAGMTPRQRRLHYAD